MSRVNPRLVYWIARLYEKHEPELTTASRDILVCLATRHLGYADGQGCCSVDALVAETQSHPATVRRALTAAQKLGMVQRTRRGHRLGDGTVVASEWQVVYPPISTAHQEPVEKFSTAQGPGSQPRTRRRPSEKSHETSLSSLDRAKRQLRDRGWTEREIGVVIEKIKDDPKVRYAGAYLATLIANGDEAGLLAEIRQQLGTVVELLPWCGECSDERTRQRFDAGDRPYRCPACHPLANGAAS